MTLDLDELAGLAWTQLWQVTLVALVIGLVARLCCRDRPRLAYALWMLVVVKSIVPPVWSSPTGVFSWALAGGVVERTEIAGERPGILMDQRAATTGDAGPTSAAHHLEGVSARDRGMNWPRYPLTVFLIWFAGLGGCAAFVAAKRIACSKMIRQWGLAVDEQYVSALADLSHRLGVGRKVRLILTSKPIGPAVFGLRQPAILLPRPLLADMPLEQVKLVLANELVHIRRGDVFAGKLQLVAQLIWWFNPLVWWASREAGREPERCCDEEVVSRLGCTPALYAQTLLSVLEHKGRLRSLVAHPGVRALEVTSLRLESIMRCAKADHRRAFYISRFVFAAGALLLMPGAGLTLRSHLLADDKGAGGQAVRSSPTAVPRAESDQEKMQGKWKIIRTEFAGRNETAVVGVQDTISGAQWLRPNRRTGEYQFQLDPTKHPKWIDLSAERLGGRTLKGIYSLDGDKLTICYAYDPELPRPTELKTTPGVRGYMYTLERVKNTQPDQKKQSDQEKQSDQGKMQGKWRIVHQEFSGRDGTSVVGVENTISGAEWLRPNRRTGEYQFQLDPTKHPKWIDLSAERLGGRTLKGIYLLDGDKLTICYAYDPELPRPTEFKTVPGVVGYMYVFERVNTK